MLIIHSADIQVKNREKNLFNATSKTLKQIEKIIADKKAEIYIMAGDLFEYPTPTDSERKLMYNHISKLLNIHTLQEIVIMAGNHDLLKEKKETINTIGNNPINVFIELISNLDSNLRKKIIYINESKVYQSNVATAAGNPSSDFQYIGYSLEDNEELKIKDIELSTKFNICLHHGMITEFVDKFKLPIRKDVYNSLSSIEKFPENSLICAGDIHMNLTFDGKNGQKYIYPGSPIQHTHNEGSFLKFTQDGIDSVGVIIEKKAESKSVKCYEFKNNSIPLTLEDIKISDLPLKDTVVYYTIEIDNKISTDIVFDIITRKLSEKLNFDAQTFIKIKSANVFLKHEKKIFEMISQLYENNNRPQIHFEYDKLIQNSETVNGSTNIAIQEIFEEKTKELSENTQSDNENSESRISILETNNIDDLVLSQNQVEKLFGSVLDSTLKSIDDTDVSNNELSTDIRALFAQQMEKSISLSGKRYNIQLESIETNGFMKLMQNHIELNIPGITRILGTNGIGKTTLYSMIRWVISGEVFPDMSKASSTKNNLIVFNKNKIDEDFVKVSLKTTINNLSVTINRTVERKWKNNIGSAGHGPTDEQKISLRWKSFIATVDKNIEIIVINSKGEENKLIGDVAEKSLKIWFGQSVENILFMNQPKLERLLNTPSDKLNEMVLDFVGIDYLKKLEDNLDAVKTDLMNKATKPTKSREDIQLAIGDIKIFKEKCENTIEQFIAEKTITQENIEILIEKIIGYNNELQNLGNIPQQILDKKIEQNILKTWLDNFEVKKEKDKIEFDEVQPVLDEKLIADYEFVKSTVIDNMTYLEEEVETNSQIIGSLIETDLKLCATTNTTKLQNSEKSIIDENLVHKETITHSFNVISKYFHETVTKLQDKLEVKQKEWNIFENECNLNKTQIDKNKKNIESGFCDKCGKAFSDDSETHKAKLLEENKNLLEANNEKIVSMSEITVLIKKIKDLILQYRGYRDLSLNEKIEILENPLVVKDLDEVIKVITTKQEILKLNNQKLIELSKDLINWKLSDKIKYNDFEILEKIENSDLSGICFRIKTINTEILGIKNAIKTQQTTKLEVEEKIKKTNETYTKALVEYQKLLNENISENNDIETYNKTVINHNNELPIKQSEFDKLGLVITNLNETKLPEYLKFKELFDLTEIDKKTFEKDLKEIDVNINAEELKKKGFENQRQILDTQYDNYLLYQKNNLIWKIYSKLIKNNFKEIVFEYYRTFLNSTLNTLLEDVPFKLYWDESSILYHISYENGQCSYQNVMASSGMETTYLALALVYTIHLLNVKNSISHIFIDEISGTLNSGTELSYEAQNYKELLVIVLNKFKDKSIFIVDHNIEKLWETQTYEVQPTENGSKYVVL